MGAAQLKYVCTLAFSHCQVSPQNSRCMELLCEGHHCAVDETLTNELSSGFDTGQYSWRPANPGQFSHVVVAKLFARGRKFKFFFLSRIWPYFIPASQMRTRKTHSSFLSSHPYPLSARDFATYKFCQMIHQDQYSGATRWRRCTRRRWARSNPRSQ